jgi:hypothetical protein
VYQSTRIVPSKSLVGTSAIDLVRSVWSACSIAKRSTVYGFVEVRVRVLDAATSSSASVVKDRLSSVVPLGRASVSISLGECCEGPGCEVLTIKSFSSH